MTLGSLAWGLSACGGPTDNGGNGSTGGGGSARVRVGWYGGAARQEKFDKIFDLFEAENSAIKVNRETADWTAYFDRLATQFAGGNAPDAVMISENAIARYKDQLLDLNTLAGGGHLKLDAFFDSALDAGTVDGKLLMLLVGSTVPGTVYNSALFSAAGVSEPTGDWRFDDYAALAVELTKNLPEGSWGAAGESAGFLPGFAGYLRQSGKSLFTDDGSAPNFSAADGESWYARWRELQDEGGIPPAAFVSEDGGRPFEDKAFARQLVAMNFTNHNQIVTYQAATGDAELKLARDPQFGSTPALIQQGSYFTVTGNSKVQEQTAAVLDFFLTDPEAAAIFGVELGAPGNSAAVDAIKPNLSPAEIALVDYSDSTRDHAVPAEHRPRGSEGLDAAFGEMWTAVAFDELTPAEAGARLVDDLATAMGAG